MKARTAAQIRAAAELAGKATISAEEAIGAIRNALAVEQPPPPDAPVSPAQFFTVHALGTVGQAPNSPDLIRLGFVESDTGQLLVSIQYLEGAGYSAMPVMSLRVFDGFIRAGAAVSQHLHAEEDKRAEALKRHHAGMAS